MKRIHKDICSQNINEAVLVMKAARFVIFIINTIVHFNLLTREIWPDDVFGSNSSSPSSEVLILKELFLNPLSGNNIGQGNFGI